MSETTGTPAAPASAPPADGAIVSPPATSQPPITISDAARLLSRQRGKTSPAGEIAPAGGGESDAAGRRPSPNDVAAAKAAPPPAAPAAPAKAADTGLTAMERALGVPAAEETAATPSVSDATPLPAPINIEGRQLKTIGEVQKFAADKQADYVTKTRELAEGRKGLESQMQALAQVLPLIQPELQRLAQIVRQVPPEPDPALLDSDPNLYHRQKAAQEAHQKEVQRLGSLAQIQTQAQTRAMEQAVASANETLAKELPFWSDPQQRMEAQQQIVTWALGQGGFSRDELRGLVSAHHLKTMMKAALWDKFAAGAKTTAPAQATVTPVRGIAPPPAASERVTQATESFQQKPDARSGAALLAARRAASSSG